MQKLLDYAYLTVDKVNRDQALGYYEDLKPSKCIALDSYSEISFVPHAQAVQNLHAIKSNMKVLLSNLPKNLMISGSTALACVLKGFYIKPNDIDLYMSDNDHNTICQIDNAIRRTYDTDIIITRTQYTINWFLKDAENKKYPNIQLVLPPARHWSEVFSSYHCDLVCIGYVIGKGKFVYARGRWDRFYETGLSYGTASFIDREYSQRVMDAIAKYRRYGFNIEMVSTGDIIVDNQIENSPRIEVKTAFEDIGKFILKNPLVSVGKFIHNIYSGEIFKDYIETMSIFSRCPTCNTLIVKKKICDPCSLKEADQLKFVKDALQNANADLRYLITGGRCGLGNQIYKILTECGRDVTVTSRFPQLTDSKKTIKLDMNDQQSVEEFEKELEDFDVLILSAAETLHYPSGNLPAELNEKAKLDWTNDFHRSDTGVWHKSIDEHSNEEIEDPIQINITSVAKIVRSFVAHQIRNKSSKQKSIIYVTSSEGLFIDKSPFHPVTNMTKTAIEQLICTMKRQADVLGMNIVMADPGWMYTKSTNGKNVGPITLEWGAAQVLLPLAKILSGEKVPNASLWSRKKKDSVVNGDAYEPTEVVKFKGVGETCPTTLDESNVMVLLTPCQHKLGLPGWYQIKSTKRRGKCPFCLSHIDSAKVVFTEVETINNFSAQDGFRDREYLEYLEQLKNIDEEHELNQSMDEMLINENPIQDPENKSMQANSQENSLIEDEGYLMYLAQLQNMDEEQTIDKNMDTMFKCEYPDQDSENKPGQTNSQENSLIEDEEYLVYLAQLQNMDEEQTISHPKNRVLEYKNLYQGSESEIGKRDLEERNRTEANREDPFLEEISNNPSKKKYE